MSNRLLFLLSLWNVISWAVTYKLSLCKADKESCSDLMRHFNLSDEDCRMVSYPLNSPNCSDRELRKENHGYDLGNMRLQSYVCMVERHAAFNVSFYNISWSSISMRFMRKKTPLKNTCRDFRISERYISLEQPLFFYDRVWSRSEYEEKTYYFEYVASSSLYSEYHKYIFIVPRWNRINPKETILSKWEVFMYVDISSSQTVTLRIQTLPKKFNVTKYLVKVHSGTIDHSVIKHEKVIIAKENDDEIMYPWNFGLLHGNFYFSVQPLSESCPEFKCMLSKSPLIIIDISYVLYAGLTLAVVTFVILVCICFKIFGSKGKELSSLPSLLLIYRSTHASHVRVVVELAKYLRKNCDIHAMVDELDINRSISQDPFDWYNGAISEAEFIAVVSSPTCCNSITGIYPEAYDTALRLLRESGFKQENFSKKCRLMVFMLPYCSKRHLPVETKNIGLHFQVPSHIKDASLYIHNYKEMNFFESYFYLAMARVKFLWNFIKNKNHTDKACKWPEMQKAIQEAISEIKKCERNRESVDSKVDCNVQTGHVDSESQEENFALEDYSVVVSPSDDETEFVIHPFQLDDILHGSEEEEDEDPKDGPLSDLAL